MAGFIYSRLILIMRAQIKAFDGDRDEVLSSPNPLREPRASRVEPGGAGPGPAYSYSAIMKCLYAAA